MPRPTTPARRLSCEHLEDRTTPAPLYVIVHGFQDESVAPAWAFDMASAINRRVGLGASEAQIDASVVRYDTATLAPPAGSAPNILIYDWAAVSGLGSPGTADNDEVAGVLTDLIRARLPSTGTQDVHLIGHSRGALVSLEVARRLNTPADGERIGRLELTTLDPQAYGSDGDGWFGSSAYPVSPNVDWAENYFQTGSVSIGGGVLRVAPERGINVDITPALTQFNGRTGTFGDHAEVHDWYHWTIDDDDRDAGTVRYRDPELNAEQDLFVANPPAGRSVLFSSTTDLNIDGTPDDLGGGSRVGFFYSIGESFAPRSFAGFGSLDLVFVIDTTSSMSDDIDAVKEAARGIIDQIRSSVPDAQLSVVLYRDFPDGEHGELDDYQSITAVPLTRDIDAVLAAIDAIEVAGGADLPESVFSGLARGFSTPWRGGNVRKSIILMGDAEAQDPEPGTGLIKEAVIRRAFDVDPVDMFTVQVNDDPNTAALFQSLAELGGGRTFVANGASNVVPAISAALTNITSGITTSASVAVGGAPDGTVRLFSLGTTTAPAQVGGPIGVFPGFTGDVRVASGDFNGDGTVDTVMVTGPGTKTVMAVVSGKDGSTLLAPTDPFGDANFTFGGFVTAGDIDRDGRAEWVVTPELRGGPRVIIFRLLADGTFDVTSPGQPSLVANFFGIGDPTFRDGDRAALGDVNGDGVLDVFSIAAFNGGPRTALYDGADVLTARAAQRDPVKLIGDFFAAPSGADEGRGGRSIAVGDVNGDGRADLIATGDNLLGTGNQIVIFSGADLAAGAVPGFGNTVLANFTVSGQNPATLVAVAAKNVDGDARADLAVGSGALLQSQVKLYLGTTLTGTSEPASTSFDPFGTPTLNGVFVG